MQFNNFYLSGKALDGVEPGHHWNYNMQFQPVLPVGLTKNWNLITRPVLQLYNSLPVPVAPGDTDRTTAFGDLILLELLSPPTPARGF